MPRCAATQCLSYWKKFGTKLKYCYAIDPDLCEPTKVCEVDRKKRKEAESR